MTAGTEGLLSTDYDHLGDDALGGDAPRQITRLLPRATVIAAAATVALLVGAAAAGISSGTSARVKQGAVATSSDESTSQGAAHFVARQYLNDDSSMIPNPMDYVYKWKHETREEDEKRYTGPKTVPLGLRAPSDAAPATPPRRRAPASSRRRAPSIKVGSCRDAALYPPSADIVKGGTHPAWKSPQGVDCAAWKANKCTGGEVEEKAGINHDTACCGCGGGVYDIVDAWQEKLNEPFRKFESIRLDTSILLLINDGQGEWFQSVLQSKLRCLSDIDCFGFSIDEVEGKVFYARSSKWKTTGPKNEGWVTYWKQLDSAVVQCDDTCANEELSKGARYDAIQNGVCEDGGEDAASEKCGYGSDCSDCGMRTYLPPSIPVMKKKPRGQNFFQGKGFNFSDVVCNDLTVLAPKGCQDLIGSDGQNWTDAKQAGEDDAKGCNWFKDDNRCRGDKADNVGYKGTSAKEACCACGGGDTTTVRAWQDGSQEPKSCHWFCEDQTRCEQSVAGPHDMHAPDACCCCGGGVVNVKAAYIEYVQDYRVPLPWYLDWEHLFGLQGLFGLFAFFCCMGTITVRENCKRDARRKH